MKSSFKSLINQRLLIFLSGSDLNLVLPSLVQKLAMNQGKMVFSKIKDLVSF